MSGALRDVAELVWRESGIRMPEHRYTALRAALRRAAPGVEPAEFMHLSADPVRSQGTIQRLLDEVTVQESAFFRDPAPLERLDWRGLLGAAREAGQAVVKVWVAGCANGEEPYTLAMLACEAFAPDPPPVSILGTDISRQALSHAHAATYGKRTLRAVGPERRARWLRAAAGGLEVRENVRHVVTLRRHNLVREPAPPPGESHFHVVTCRNVLSYFDQATARRVTRQLEAALAPSGVLILGAIDALTAGPGRPVDGRASDPCSTARSSARALVAERNAVADPTRQQRLTRARSAADANRADEALAEVDALVRRNPLDPDAHVLRGLVKLATGDADAAVVSLRRAVYAEPGFGMAAYMLGRAHDAAGRPAAACVAYAQALRSLAPADQRNAVLFGEVDVTEIQAACRARLAAGRW